MSLFKIWPLAGGVAQWQSICLALVGPGFQGSTHSIHTHKKAGLEPTEVAEGCTWLSWKGPFMPRWCVPLGVLALGVHFHVT